MLVDPRRIKNVSGRKTDATASGCTVAHLRQPDADSRLSQLRAMLVQYASHPQYAEGADPDERSSTSSATSPAHIEANGTPASWRASWHERPTIATLAGSTSSVVQRIAECDREIEAQLERFEDLSDGESSAPDGKKRGQGNAPRFDIRTHLFRMTGVDLTRIDGNGFTALKVFSEVLNEMAERQALWLGLSPDNRITGGRLKDQAQRSTGGHCERAAPLRQCSRSCAGPDGCAQGHHRHGAQAERLIYSMLRYSRSTWMLGNISSRCARPSVGRRNWATSWCLYPMVKTGLQAFP